MLQKVYGKFTSSGAIGFDAVSFLEYNIFYKFWYRMIFDFFTAHSKRLIRI